MTLEYIPAFWDTLDTVLKESQMFVFAEAPPMNEVTAFVTDIIANNDIQFIALSGSQVVGWCDILVKRLKTLKHSGALGLGVLPSHRRLGVGGALLARTLDMAKDRGLTRVELFVRTDNERAIRLYEKHGFVKEGLLRRHVRIGGTYRDSYLMSLLSEASSGLPGRYPPP